MSKIISKILKALFIVQEKTLSNKFNQQRKVSRLNPYNPLTYVTIIIALMFYLPLFGIIGFSKLDLKNTFKYE